MTIYPMNSDSRSKVGGLRCCNFALLGTTMCGGLIMFCTRDFVFERVTSQKILGFCKDTHSFCNASFCASEFVVTVFIPSCAWEITRGRR